ncbi:MAG: hypothetical protein AMJ62_05725 [Myxococcales bacterium SG8_38]|nr:MAG: hypothetical protein AMJ62_05725 [Myxococcales bacterium SG8_38]
MSKPLLTLAITLSLGTVGCAGLGTQHASSLSAQIHDDHGLDGLWMPAEREPSQGLDTSRYSQGLGALWSGEDSTPGPSGDPGYYDKRSGGDLWNPASVTRSWQRQETQVPARPSRAYLFGDASSRGRAGRARASR